MTVERDGPILVEGPVEVVREDGTVASSDRFMVAICTCRRTRTAPWCDTSHRRRRRPPAPDRARPAPSAGAPVPEEHTEPAAGPHRPADPPEGGPPRADT
ncbi:hypothetical protein RVR_457 [Actinacidiphila reveromycinica]|uniref:Iron-binding zinc finger CDGSH type domain-containing protein n=1 Tax=Actinacidiphila reveromycinica TaxID=659352 RepID=A0A7U3VLH4_9ACTN|nr:CDGSH iron-sulfur domain-containing protein [Streptomyces sp. SN-593]BBA95555.1 hypothetical protein RVR_457 [Streptomyces sp. SN-593]